MADEGIKKVILKSAEFPLIQFDTVYNNSTARDEINNLYYDFRYRVVSEDKNFFSAWSSINHLIMPDVSTPFPYAASENFSITKAGNPEIITAVWSNPSNPTDYEKIFNKINIFDVWIRWNNNNTTDLNDAGWEPWRYQTMVSSNTWSIIKRDSSVKRIEIAIQIPTEVKTRDYNNNKITLFRGLSDTI